MDLDDMTEAATRRVIREQNKMQRQLREDGMELSVVIAIAMISDVAITLIDQVGVDPTQAFLDSANALFAQHAAMTDLEWAGYDHANLDWAEIAVKHLGPHLEDPDEARHVGLIVGEVMWHMGHLPQTDGWVTALVNRVSSFR
jgi:hypothetical protein